MPDPSTPNDNSFTFIPMDQAPTLLLQTISRFADGQTEPMVIGAAGQPVAALIPIADLLRLRDYDNRALDSEDLFYAELRHRVHDSDVSAIETDLDAFARSLGPLGQQWADQNSGAEKK